MNQYRCNDCGQEAVAQLATVFLGVACPACGSAMSIVRQEPLSFGWRETLGIGLAVLILWGISRNPRKWLL
jgi:hypothetical protein